MDFDTGLGMISFLEMLADGVSVPDYGLPGECIPLVSKEGEPFLESTNTSSILCVI